MNEFQIGKAYFTPYGTQVELVSLTVDNKFVVADILETFGEDGEPYTDLGQVHIEQRLLVDAPRQKRDEEIVELDAKIAEAKERLKDIQRQAITAAHEHANLIKKFKNIPALRHIEDFIDGKITHVLILSGYDGLEIKTFHEAFDYVDRTYYGGAKVDGMKLVSLFGDSKGNLNYNIHQYKDGSGSLYQTILPFKSEEEAIAAAKEHIHARLSDLMAKTKDDRCHGLAYVLRDADKFSVEAPYILRRELWEMQKKGADESLAKAEKELAERLAAVNKLSDAEPKEMS